MLDGGSSRRPLGLVTRERPDTENDGAGSHIECPRRTRPPDDKRQHYQRDPYNRFHNTVTPERERLPATLREFCHKSHCQVDARQDVGEHRCGTGELDDGRREREGDNGEEVENTVDLRTQDRHLSALREVKPPSNGSRLSCGRSAHRRKAAEQYG